MRIIVDLDEVVVDMMTPLLKKYNAHYSSDITIEDITQWELPQDMMVMFQHGEFFLTLPEIEGAIDGVNKLLEWGHDVVIATNHSNVGRIARDKSIWILAKIPALSNNMMIGSRKDLLQGDIIIDDNADYLINSPCPIKICMDRPWNTLSAMTDYQKTKWLVGLGDNCLRVFDWQDILALFEGGAFKVW